MPTNIQTYSSSFCCHRRKIIVTFVSLFHIIMILMMMAGSRTVHGFVSRNQLVKLISSNNPGRQFGSSFGISSLGMVLADHSGTRSIHNHSENAITNNTNQSNLEPLVICGPSGVGKGTLIEGIRKYLTSARGEDPFGFVVSHTTRRPRPGEIHGIHYYFTDMEKMQSAIDNGDFVEYAKVHGNIYGTSKSAIETLQSQNKITILDIDMQGVQSVKQHIDFQAKYMFITPPSIQILEGRLRGRQTESEQDIQKRISNAEKEIEYGTSEGNFDSVVVNDDIDKAINEMIHVLQEWYPQLRNNERK